MEGKRSLITATLHVSAVALLFFTLSCLLVGCGSPSAESQYCTPEQRDSLVAQSTRLRKAAVSAREQASFAQALCLVDSALSLSRQADDSIEQVRCLNEMGTNFRRMGRLEEALRYHYEALSLAEQVKDTAFQARKNLVRSLNGLGNVHLSLGDDHEAEMAFRRALRGEESLGSTLGQAINWANLGSILERRDQWDSAFFYYQRSMELNRSIDNIVGQSLCHNYFGRLYELKEMNDSARACYQRSLAMMRDSKDRWHAVEAAISLARLALSQKKYKEAKPYLDCLQQAVGEMQSYPHYVEYYQLLAQYDEQRGDLRAALHDYRQATAFGDSVLNGESERAIRDVVVQYEHQKAQRDVERIRAAYEREQHLHRVITWSAFLIIALLLVVLIAVAWARCSHLKALDALRQVDAVRNAFFRNVTHEFRTPLTAILGLSEVAQRPETNTDVTRCMNSIHEEAQRVLSLVNNLLDETRKEAAVAPLMSLDPLQEQPEAEAAAVTAARYDEADGKPLVMVVEDEPNIRYLIEHLLAPAYQVITATNGRDALQKTEQQQPDLIVTDVMMPDMDGYALCRAVRDSEMMADVPVVMVTARVEDEDRMRGYEEGADAYITKPFNPQELLLRVNKLLEQREKLRQHLLKQLETMEVAAGADEQKEPELQDSPLEETDELPVETEREVPDAKDRSFLDRLNQVILERMGDGKLTVDVLCRELATSPTPLNNKVHALTGLPIASYAMTVRMQKARALLRDGFSIGEVSVICGFGTQSYFTRVYKRFYGVLPSQEKG